jgi:UDP-N-acetylglucosamine 2-epimerase (non-hydrolysing)
MRKVKIILAGGARPNFVKIAPLYHSFSRHNRINPILVHTGQHSDQNMSEQFFNDLSLPQPDYFLQSENTSPNRLTAQILISFEKVLRKEHPDLVVVTGDVTSTVACALAAVNEKIPVAHVEAGLRSKDKTMPEEINRIITDHLSQWLFVSESEAIHNLMNENIPLEKISFAGNVMIDSLHYHLKSNRKAELNSILPKSPYILVTMHRPSNVDSKENLLNTVSMIEQIAALRPVVFPVHPRTQKKLMEYQLLQRLTDHPDIFLKEPLGYHVFMQLMRGAEAVVTDSGGVQEETTYLQIPCLTFRESTERPVTVSEGTNYLIHDLETASLVTQLRLILRGKIKPSKIPQLWDGNTAHRITEVILADFDKADLT